MPEKEQQDMKITYTVTPQDCLEAGKGLKRPLVKGLVVGVLLYVLVMIFADARDEIDLIERLESMLPFIGLFVLNVFFPAANRKIAYFGMYWLGILALQGALLELGVQLGGELINPWALRDHAISSGLLFIFYGLLMGVGTSSGGIGGLWRCRALKNYGYFGENTLELTADQIMIQRGAFRQAFAWCCVQKVDVRERIILLQLVAEYGSIVISETAFERPSDRQTFLQTLAAYQDNARARDLPEPSRAAAEKGDAYVLRWSWSLEALVAGLISAKRHFYTTRSFWQMKRLYVYVLSLALMVFGVGELAEAAAEPSARWIFASTCAGVFWIGIGLYGFLELLCCFTPPGRRYLTRRLMKSQAYAAGAQALYLNDIHLLLYGKLAYFDLPWSYLETVEWDETHVFLLCRDQRMIALPMESFSDEAQGAAVVAYMKERMASNLAPVAAAGATPTAETSEVAKTSEAVTACSDGKYLRCRINDPSFQRNELAVRFSSTAARLSYNGKTLWSVFGGGFALADDSGRVRRVALRINGGASVRVVIDDRQIHIAEPLPRVGRIVPKAAYFFMYWVGLFLLINCEHTELVGYELLPAALVGVVVCWRLRRCFLSYHSFLKKCGHGVLLVIASVFALSFLLALLL